METYARQLHVDSLMDRHPEQLSGGERQRISVIRALLSHPTLLLADEPSASLDAENSRRMAALMRELKSPERVILIATHEDCFDDVADEILHLDYGTLREEDAALPAEPPVNAAEDAAGPAYNPGWGTLLRIVVKRQKKSWSLGSLVAQIAVVLILLLCLSLQNRFSVEYTRLVMQGKPFDIFSLSTDWYEELKDEYSFKAYPNYQIIGEGAVGFALLPRENSALAISDMIECGRFPEAPDDMLVPLDYATKVLKTAEAKDALGQTVELAGRRYTVSGVLTGNKDYDKYLYSNDYYEKAYYETVYPSTVYSLYIPYDTARQYGRVMEGCPATMVTVPGLTIESPLYTALLAEAEARGSSALSIWDREYVELQTMIDMIFMFVMVGVAIAGAIAFLFISNDIRLDLYYRRREIGYLQVFHVSRRTILRMLMLERCIRAVLALACALVLYAGLLIAAYAGWGIRGMADPVWLCVLAAVIIAYNLLLSLWPGRRFLKQSIIQLITT